MEPARFSVIVLCAVFEPQPAAQSQSQGAQSIVVIARLGKLRDAEVSPRAASRAPVLWSIALEGVTLTQVDCAPDVALMASMDDLRRSVLPDGATSALIDLSSPRAEAAGGLAPALQKLREAFRAPPPPEAKEVAAIESLRKALGARDASLSPLAPNAPDVSPLEPALAFREAAARSPAVILVRVMADDDGDEAVARRDEMLKGILDAAGADVHALILDFPSEGPGTLVARGPRFKRGRVIAKSIALPAVRASVASLLGETAAKEDNSTAEAPVHELFK